VEDNLREKEFLVLLGNDTRIRHFHARIRQQVTEFVVQLELFIDGKWKPIVRYDTAHGFAHRDTFHCGGKTEKTPLFIGDYSSTLTFAEMDLRSNWELYRDRYLKEVHKDD
jgi:hypothetical protein